MTDVVQGAGDELVLAVGVMESRFQDQARADEQILRGNIGQDFLDFRFGHGGQEAEAPDVHAENRHLRGKDRIDHVDERAIPARDQQDVRFFRQFDLGETAPFHQGAASFFKQEIDVGVPLRELAELIQDIPRARLGAVHDYADSYFFCSSHKNSSFPSRPGSGEGIVPTVVTG